MDKPIQPTTGPGTSESAPIDWRQNWQLPALLAAGLLLLGGVLAAVFTRPAPNVLEALDEAEAHIAAERFNPAITTLKERVKPYIEAGGTPPALLRRFHLDWARATYLGQQAERVDRDIYHQKIIEQYLEAEKAGAALEPRDLQFLVNSYVSLGLFDKARTRILALPPEEGARRGELLRRIVTKMYELPNPDPVSTLELLAEFQRSTGLEPSDRAWALARRAELLLRQGYTEEAIAMLHRLMPSVMDADPAELGELHMFLGRAYFEAGSPRDAARQLELAVRALPPNDEQRGASLAILAQIDAGSGEKDDARQKFAAIIDEFTDSPIRLVALLGLGQAQADLGAADDSIATFGMLVDEINAGRKHRDVTPERVTQSLLDRYLDRTLASDIERAVKYAMLAERLYRKDKAPASILLSLAQANRTLAEKTLQGVGPGGSRALDLSRVDPATRETARVYFVNAAGYFKRHAEAVSDTDNQAYGESLWRAADSFDLAGDQGEAIPLFTEYIEAFPDDPRQAEARFRLAHSYQARGDYDMAASLYQGLIEAPEGGGPGSGPYGDASYVPLAQVLLADNEPNNDAEARRLLAVVVDGGIGGTETSVFRDAIVQLAGVDYRTGDFAAAITRLVEATTRFPNDPQIASLLYQLADSYRQEAAAIGRTLEEAMPDDRRIALASMRADHLSRAGELFTQASETLEAMDPARRTPLDNLQLRNSAFYLADCRFEMKDYDTAIRLYDAARERYPSDPASLVAMVQIVNAYLAKGDGERARAANDRALRFYKSLPESAWLDPNLPMGKREWQRWLDSMARLLPNAAGVNETATTDAGEGPQR